MRAIPRISFELRLLAPMLLLFLAAWTFIAIADAAMDGDAHAVDMWILSWLRVGPEGSQQPIGPRWFQEVMRDLTALGSPAVMVLIITTTIGWLLMARQWAMAALALAAMGGGQLAVTTLKHLFSRARPDEVFHATVASGYSFPSGHTMMSTIVFLTLAALTARLTASTRLRVFAMATAGLITGLVGSSRVYLGVHWASDVAAGWTAGAAWALLCWLVADRLGVGRKLST